MKKKPADPDVPAAEHGGVRPEPSMTTTPLPDLDQAPRSGSDAAQGLGLTTVESIRQPRLVRVRDKGMAMARSKAMQAAAWNIGSYGANQVIRLVCTIILTRLLYPEAYGLMALMATFLTALSMFSDVGIGPSIIQHKRGDDAAFINTAWTMQVIRGVMIWLASCALAWPLAQFYDKPQIAYLLPVMAFSVVVSGLFSTSLYTLNRSLNLGKLVVLDLSTQIAGQTLTILIALAYKFGFVQAAFGVAGPGWNWLNQGVWAMVLGAVIGPGLRMMGSHFLDTSLVNRFHWEPEAARAIFRFGRWIFVSTFLTFLALQLDNLLLGNLLTAHDLGLYSIAKNLGTTLTTAVASMGSMVAFPLLARVAREHPGNLAARNRKVRAAIVLPSACLMAVFTIFGHWLVDLLYDPRYAEAGWMLQVFAGGSFATLVALSYGSVLLALGKSNETVILLLGQILFMLVGSLVGFYTYGLPGFIVGFALTEWLNYPIVVSRVRKHGMWNPDVDLATFAIAGVSIAIAVLIW